MKLIAVLLAASTVPLAAQWLNYPEAWTPHTSDGKPDLTAPAPRMTDNGTQIIEAPKFLAEMARQEVDQFA